MTLRRMTVCICLLIFSQSKASSANEPYADRDEWIQRGYTELQHKKPGIPSPPEHPTWTAHSLSWPIEFQDAQHSIGNSMAEFQSYGDGPYYHGGCDLRVKRKAEVKTPIAGRIEAGHYGYSNNPDGSATKFWKPWPKSGDRNYFEVAVITEDGYRFEFHHMDESALSEEVLKILKAGSGSVPAGAFLGKTISWPDGVYHHTHYNILTPSGVQLNPEHYSLLLRDTLAPEVSAVIASFKDGTTADFGTGNLPAAPEFFAVATIDHQNDNVYDHPPVLAGIEFENGKSFYWDFSERLSGAAGAFPPIWDFFVQSIQSPSGKTYATDGGYGQGLSVVRIPVPFGASGRFTLTIGDEAGNQTRFNGIVAGSPNFQAIRD